RPPHPANTQRRRQAARIASEMSQPWSIPEMISLLKDNDGEIRFFAARALQRLAGLNMNYTPEQWRRHLSEPTYNQWTQWWQNNRERYPTGPMGPSAAPAPISKETKAKAGN